MFCLLALGLVREQLAFCFTFHFQMLLYAAIFFVAWLGKIFIFFPENSLTEKKNKNNLWLSLYLAANSQKEDLCCTNTWDNWMGISESIFIWARIYFQTIKQPSSSTSGWCRFWIWNFWLSLLHTEYSMFHYELMFELLFYLFTARPVRSDQLHVDSDLVYALPISTNAYIICKCCRKKVLKPHRM